MDELLEITDRIAREAKTKKSDWLSTVNLSEPEPGGIYMLRISDVRIEQDNFNARDTQMVVDFDVPSYPGVSVRSWFHNTPKSIVALKRFSEAFDITGQNGTLNIDKMIGQVGYAELFRSKSGYLQVRRYMPRG